MNFTFKKRSGVSILSLKHEKHNSQSQTQATQSQNVAKKSSTSELPVPSGNCTPNKISLKPELEKTDKERQHSATKMLDSSSDSPLKITPVDLDSSDDDGEPVKLKRKKTVPDLKKLKNKQDMRYDICKVEATNSAPAATENEPGAKKLKMEEITSRLKVFEKSAPGKFAVKGIESERKSSPRKSLEVEVAPAMINAPVATNACVKESVKVKPSAGAAKVELPCPVCNRNFKRNLRGHMKACAGKNGLTTEQLMLALELQRKQEDERQRLGLPQYLVNKKQTVNKKSGKTSDPNIQLALALSKSLKEAEEEAYLRETRMMLENQEDMTESQVAAAITAVTSEPETSVKGIQTVLVTGEARQLGIKKAPASTSSLRTVAPPYMTTSAEERLRRVTEKVAMCLLDEETSNDFVQKQPALRSVQVSDVLKRKLEEGNGLWKLATVSCEQEKDVYYVKGLREFVSPSVSNSGVLNLQPLQPSFPKPKDCIVKKRAHLPKLPSPKKRQESNLGRDWASILNSKTMSDVVVYAKDDVELRAHKLVLLVRCPAILKDLAAEMSQDGESVKEHMLLWSEFSESVVIAALEFIYCDSTCRALRLGNKDVQDLEALAQRYELTELLSHMEMMKKLRDQVHREDEQTNSSTSTHEPEPSLQIVETLDSRSELSYLVSQMDKSIFATTLVPTNDQTKIIQPEEAISAEVPALGSPNDDLKNIDLTTSLNNIKSSQDFQRSSVDDGVGELDQIQSQSDDDLFASLHDSKIYMDLLEDNTERENVEPAENDDSEDWRNLDGLDYLDTTPKRPKSTAALAPNTPTLASQESNTDATPHFEASPFSSPMERAMSELEVVTLSSDSASQKSVVSISPKMIVHTPDHHSLDDSVGVCEDLELTHLELAALKAYEKVMTPKPPSRAASTPGSSRITPMLDYSLMESPQLQKELDRYGIKHLRRNQAKLILRHIYDELHPKISSTPLARPANKTKKALQMKSKENQTLNAALAKASTSKATQPPTRITTPKKTTPVKKPAVKQPVHNISFAPPDEDYDSFDELLFDKPKRKTMSQPAIQRSSDSDFSDSSNNEGYGKYHGDDALEDVFTQQITETQSDVLVQIEEALKSDPGLYHRILTYEPIWLEEIKDLLKTNKVRVNPKVLLDFLDDQCITYRTDHQRPVKRAAQKRVWTQSQRGRKKKDFDV
ncbi:Hypothetical predicted protein [Cloeon dipterum]|uniref:Structure-specific endonuclease subunit SLX4 n=1 Tax=Cloeon dipterum TaxID=197152 RepID=A0A8S1D8W8_9INSE|nr:Hypothetical predicted protein [Cloeon dipterum]